MSRFSPRLRTDTNAGNSLSFCLRIILDASPVDSGGEYRDHGSRVLPQPQCRQRSPRRRQTRCQRPGPDSRFITRNNLGLVLIDNGQDDQTFAINTSDNGGLGPVGTLLRTRKDGLTSLFSESSAGALDVLNSNADASAPLINLRKDDVSAPVLSVTRDGNAALDGSATVSGSLAVGGEIESSLIPDDGQALSLGSATAPWRTITAGGGTFAAQGGIMLLPFGELGGDVRMSNQNGSLAISATSLLVPEITADSIKATGDIVLTGDLRSSSERIRSLHIPAGGFTYSSGGPILGPDSYATVPPGQAAITGQAGIDLPVGARIEELTIYVYDRSGSRINQVERSIRARPVLFARASVLTTVKPSDNQLTGLGLSPSVHEFTATLDQKIVADIQYFLTLEFDAPASDQLRFYGASIKYGIFTIGQ